MTSKTLLCIVLNPMQLYIRHAEYSSCATHWRTDALVTFNVHHWSLLDANPMEYGHNIHSSARHVYIVHTCRQTPTHARAR